MKKVLPQSVWLSPIEIDLTSLSAQNLLDNLKKTLERIELLKDKIEEIKGTGLNEPIGKNIAQLTDDVNYLLNTQGSGSGGSSGSGEYNSNLANKTLNETITGSWTFSRPISVKSISGLNNQNLLITGKNYGVEIRIDEDSSGHDSFIITRGSSSPTVLMKVHSSGNVGIGTTSPSERLEVSGNIKSFSFISTAPTGISPFQVSSTTKVNNLNADFLDGYDSSDFPRKAENATITGNWAFNNNLVVQGSENLKILDSDLMSWGARLIEFRTNSNVLQWAIGHKNAPGSNNTGNDFAIWNYDNSGSYLSQPLTIKRNSGFIGINKADPEYRLVVEEFNSRIATAIRKTNNGNGGDGSLDGPTLLVENSYGNHSWGNLAEFRINDSSTLDPPHITFTAGWSSVGWSVGMAGPGDADFGIASNRGWRFGSFGTLQLRIKEDGQLITRGAITAPAIQGSNTANLLLNGRNFGVEIRIDEDSQGGNTFKVTKGANGSITLLEIENGGHLHINGLMNIGWFDLKLGTADQNTRGNTGPSRALVKDHGAILAINYAGDFNGGVRVDGPGMTITGNLNVNGTITGSLNANAVGTTQLANGAVTTEKIADGAITASKLAPGALIRMFQTTIGDGINSTYIITHSLNTTNVEVSLILLHSNEKIGAKVVVLNVNQIQVSFISPIAANSVKVIVIG
jgi:hypothetical protein